jgi:uncharacterized protein YfaP (DUF2135 family)
MTDVKFPSVEAYKQAFELAQMSDAQRSMLRAHFLAPDSVVTTIELAQAAGYQNFQAANAQYGRLGTQLREILSWDGPGQQSHILAGMVPSEEGWLWDSTQKLLKQ